VVQKVGVPGYSKNRQSCASKGLPRFECYLVLNHAKKSNGEGKRLGFTGHLLMEIRDGPVVDVRLTHATGAAEPEAALAMLGDLPDFGKKTVGADKNYDAAVFVAARTLGVTPHSSQTTGVSDSFISGAALCIRRPVSAWNLALSPDSDTGSPFFGGQDGEKHAISGHSDRTEPGAVPAICLAITACHRRKAPQIRV
jgi:hypothetical protein